MPKNGEDWGKLIVAKGFKKLPKVQNIAQSGHTDHNSQIKGLLLPRFGRHFISHCRPLFAYFRSFQAINTFLDFSRTQTRIVGVEEGPADHQGSDL